jgi:hypothetical protein
VAEKLPLWRSQALLHRVRLDLMFVQISWTVCFMKSLFSSTHSRTSLLLLAPASLGVQQSLPSPLCMLSASHLSTSNQIVLMSFHIVEVSSPSDCLTANGSSVTLPRKTYPFDVQRLRILQMKCTIWAAHMGILSLHVRGTASLSMHTLVPR